MRLECRLFLPWTLALLPIALSDAVFHPVSRIHGVNRVDSLPFLRGVPKLRCGSSASDRTLSAGDASVFQAAAIRDRVALWMLPAFGALVSYWTFPMLSQSFHALVQFASRQTWLPSSTEDLNLQATVVTQVVNGPVITSISVLFATLVSMTIGNLHARQLDIQKSAILEVQAVRQIQHLLQSTMAQALQVKERQLAQTLLNEHFAQLVLEDEAIKPTTMANLDDPHPYVESNLLLLLDAMNNMLLSKRQAAKESLVSQLRVLMLRVMNERSNRWLAMKALHFPLVHYVTLTLLAFSIGVAFLVATDEAEFIFQRGFPVRILWTLLVTSFTALAVLCYDLSTPFRGAYRVGR